MTITIKQINIIAARAREVGDRDLVSLCERAMRSDDAMAELVDHARHNADLVRLLKEAPVDSISIGELKAIRAKMNDPGEWLQGRVSNHKVFLREEIEDPTRDDRVVVQANTNFPYLENIAGIVAAHNAMPILLEVVESLIAYEAARDSAAVDEAEWMRAPSLEVWGKIEKSGAHMRRCEAAYNAARSKVRP